MLKPTAVQQCEGAGVPAGASPPGPSTENQCWGWPRKRKVLPRQKVFKNTSKAFTLYKVRRIWIPNLGPGFGFYFFRSFYFKDPSTPSNVGFVPYRRETGQGSERFTPMVVRCNSWGTPCTTSGCWLVNYILNVTPACHGLKKNQGRPWFGLMASDAFAWTVGASGVTLMTWLRPGGTAAPHAQLLAFQAEQGHTSLVSKVLSNDYTGFMIHYAVQDVPNYTLLFFLTLFHKLQFHKNIDSPSKQNYPTWKIEILVIFKTLVGNENRNKTWF